MNDCRMRWPTGVPAGAMASWAGGSHKCYGLHCGAHADVSVLFESCLLLGSWNEIDINISCNVKFYSFFFTLEICIVCYIVSIFDVEFVSVFSVKCSPFV